MYLWGFLVHDRAAGTKQYVGFSEFSDLNSSAEWHLATKAMGWLRSVVEADPARTVRVYHYSDYELIRLARVEQAGGGPVLAWAREWAVSGFTDMFGCLPVMLFTSS